MKKSVIALISAASLVFALSATAMTTGHGHGGHGQAAATATETKVVSTNGVVVAVDPAGRQITLNHEPIPAINWPAMTMDLDLADPSLAADIKPGDKIVFELKRLSATDYVITGLHRRP